MTAGCEEEGCVGEDLPVSVGVVGGDVEDGLLAGLHGDDALVPALDDATDADGGLEVAAADGGVKSGEGG